MLRLLLCVLAMGCARADGPPPNTAVRAWLAASARDDSHAAFRLLSHDLHLSEKEFTARWRASAEERKAQANALGPLAVRLPPERGHAVWSDGREAHLVREPSGWRVATPRVTPPGAASPEDAVRRFAEALEQHNLDGLLDILAEPLRSQLERELSDRLLRLKGALNKEIQVEGAKARIRLDDRFYLELKLEDGRWRVSDFN